MHLGRSRVGADGPVRRLVDAAFVCQTGGSIDPSPFVDETGQPWLLWKSEATRPAPPTIWSQAAARRRPRASRARRPRCSALGQSWGGGGRGPSMVRIGRPTTSSTQVAWTTAGSTSEGVRPATARGTVPPSLSRTGARLGRAGRRSGRQGRSRPPGGGVWLACRVPRPDVGYPNSRTLHFATVRIVNGVPVVTPQWRATRGSYARAPPSRRESASSSETSSAKLSSETSTLRALLSIDFSPAERPFDTSRSARFRTTSATW